MIHEMMKKYVGFERYQQYLDNQHQLLELIQYTVETNESLCRMLIYTFNTHLHIEEELFVQLRGQGTFSEAEIPVFLQAYDDFLARAAAFYSIDCFVDVKSGNLLKAKETALIGLNLCPEDCSLLCYLGFICEKLGDLVQSLEAYRKASSVSGSPSLKKTVERLEQEISRKSDAAEKPFKEKDYSRAQQKRRKPNFFIIGAAKSATTSLYEYLKVHPQIFFPHEKEINYFAVKYFKYHFGIPIEPVYRSLYSNCADEKILGEASPTYLYFKDIAKHLKQFQPKAKLLISLRNPIDRALSHYKMAHYRDKREVLPLDKALDFALSYQANKDKHPTFHPVTWKYKEQGLYYEQVKEYMDVFGKKKVKVILFRDLARNSADVIKDICGFLHIDRSFYDDFEFKRYNIGNVQKKPDEQIRLEEKIKGQLIDYYKDDVAQLSQLLDIDLSFWLDGS